MLLKYLERPLAGGLKDICACHQEINGSDLEQGTTLNKIQRDP